MGKAIFFKVVSNTECAPTMQALPNQTYTLNGKEEKVKTTIQALPRGTAGNFVEGEHYATNTVSESTKNGWYAVGNELYKITNENGMVFTGGQDDPYVDAKHEEYCKKYREYLNGGAIPTGGLTDKSKRRKKTFLETLQADKSLHPPTIEDNGWYVDVDTWWYLIRNLAKRKNTIMIGKSGAGKTELIRMLTSKLGKTLNIFDMAVSNPNKTFCGNLRAEAGTTHFQYARFAMEIQNPGVILMDELSRAAPTANNIFLPVLDGRRTLYIEDAITEAEIKVNPDCMFWATANIGAEFIGTSGLDHALMNRFNQIAIHYPPADKEALLLQKLYGLNSYDSEAIVKVATGVRENTDLSKDISTRQLFEVAELVGDGYSKLDAFKWSVLQQFEGSDTDGGERATVLSIIQSV